MSAYPRPKRSTGGEEGMTLIEVMIAATLLATGIVAMLGVIITSSQVKTLAQEEFMAMQAAQAKVSEIMSRSYDDVWDIYNTSTADDPAGVWAASPWVYNDPVAGVSRNYAHNMFQVGDLGVGDLHPPENATGTQSFPHGQVLIIDDETPSETTWGVDINGNDSNADGDGYNDNPAWSMDLNGDGDLADSGAAVNAAFVVTPVVVRVRWRSTVTGRTEQVILRTFLVNRHPS